MSVSFLQSTKEFRNFCPYIVETNEGESLKAFNHYFIFGGFCGITNPIVLIKFMPLMYCIVNMFKESFYIN